MEFSTRFFSKDGFMELAPVHECSKLQRHTLLLPALSTSDSEKREHIDRRRRWSTLAPSTGIYRSADKRSRRFQLFLTSQWMTGAPLHQCGRRQCHHGSILGLVLAATRTTTPTLLHRSTSAQIDDTGILHEKIC
jgi:hypothetical protein